jgi:hypothetical protein
MALCQVKLLCLWNGNIFTHLPRVLPCKFVIPNFQLFKVYTWKEATSDQKKADSKAKWRRMLTVWHSAGIDGAAARDQCYHIGNSLAEKKLKIPPFVQKIRQHWFSKNSQFLAGNW